MKLEPLTEEEWRARRPPIIIPPRLRELGGFLELLDGNQVALGDSVDNQRFGSEYDHEEEEIFESM